MFNSKAMLYVQEPIRAFGGYSIPYDKAKYVVLGVPLDETGTFRSGYRLAPYRVREVSEALETFSLRVNMDYEGSPVHDLGDIVVAPGDLERTLYRVEEVLKSIVLDGKIPIIIGGEHTITYPVIKVLKAFKPCVVVLDAHFDLRHEYLGSRMCHATVMRRVSEIIGLRNMFFVGVRAFCSEEANLVKQKGVEHLPAHVILKHGISKTVNMILKFLRNCNKIYLTVDMDVFDPSFAPAVGNPEPEGLTPTLVLDILSYIVNDKLVGLDINEITPSYDVNDITSILAAKLIMEIVTYHRTRSKLL
ncbi:MAG: agmatinase [Thermoprotei archaeon]|nr:MAG: agmatinase [Thermoprotei archaeon]